MQQRAIPLWAYITALFLVSAFIRWTYITHLEVDHPIRGDAISYVQYAQNILHHNTFSKERSDSPTPDAYWSPGYPTFLAITFELAERLGADLYKTVLILQALMGALLVVITFLIGRLFLPVGYALGASALLMISPHQISLGGYILTETLFSLSLLTSLLLFFYTQKKSSITLYILCGLSFGISYLINPVVLVAPICLLASLFINKESEQHSKNKVMAAYILCSFLTIVFAWQIRSTINVEDSAQSSSDRIFINLVIGTHHDFHSVYRENPRDPNNPATTDLNRFGGSYGKFTEDFSTRVLDDPLHYLNWYFITKPIMLWDWDILVGQGDIFVYPVNISMYHTLKTAIASHVLMKRAHMLLFAIACFGLFFVFKGKTTNKTAEQLYITLVSISAVYVVLQAEGRYSIPLRPEMYLCAMYFIYALKKYLKNEAHI